MEKAMTIDDFFREANDLLCELSIEQDHAKTFNNLLVDAIVDTSIIEYPYERSVAEATTHSMLISFVQMEEKISQLNALLMKLKPIAKEC